MHCGNRAELCCGDDSCASGLNCYRAQPTDTYGSCQKCDTAGQFCCPSGYYGPSRTFRSGFCDNGLGCRFDAITGGFRCA
jgi:hypothetical protein